MLTNTSLFEYAIFYLPSYQLLGIWSFTFGTIINNTPLNIHVHILVGYEKAWVLECSSVEGIFNMCKALDSASHNMLMHTHVYTYIHTHAQLLSDISPLLT